MANMKKWIEEKAEGQLIEGVVIGEMGWGDYGSDRGPNYADCPKGKLLPWEDACQWLSYEFDSGYGAPECQSVVAWTKDWIISVSQYDGSTCPFRIPRNPVDFMPEMVGG